MNNMAIYHVLSDRRQRQEYNIPTTVTVEDARKD